ncbi:MAG: DUF362 domain-containing protein [Anaerolineales bacterium]|nr:DUF362 domain-containing protein [Anaerolineales bacterium]
MSATHYKFGPTTIAKLNNPGEIRQFLDDSLLKSDTVIIKPNWVSTDQADFTDADTLRVFIEALDSRIVVTESYCLARSLNLLSRGLGFTVEGKEVDWKWLLKGDGWKWLIQNPDWEWFKTGEHRHQIVLEDKAFIDEYGFADLFEEFKVEYINATEEVWSSRIANPAEVKGIVESRYKPVQNEKLYAMVPAKLFNLRNSTFISFARMKMYASFTIKNLFGMIIDPLRPYWHGAKNRTIVQSIIDINKIYHSLFSVFGICESIFTMPVIHPEGKYEGIYSGKYDIYEGSGFVALGGNLAALDALLLHLTDPTIRMVAEVNRGPIDLAGDELGLEIDRECFEGAVEKVGKWITPS